MATVFHRQITTIMTRLFAILFFSILNACNISNSHIDNTQFISVDNKINDSIQVCEIVDKFYRWYISAIKENRNSEYMPEFVKNGDSMTTLDFSKYIDNLIRYDFSNSFIIKEKQSYKTCIDNLNKVKYSDFNRTKFIDLDEYEESRCDFGNYYRWTGGQEICDGVKVQNVIFSDTENCIVTADKFDLSEGKEDYFFWGRINVALKKEMDKWKIISISWK